jgi:hypothetical protein
MDAIYLAWGSLSNDSNYGLCASIWLYSPGSAKYKIGKHQTVEYASNVSSLVMRTGASFYLSSSAVNGIRFLMNSGNITSGIIRIYGMKK